MHEIRKGVIKKSQKGNQMAFTKIIDFYKDEIFQTCYVLTENKSKAEMLASNTFIEAYSLLDTYNYKRKFSTWLIQVSIILYKDSYNRIFIENNNLTPLHA